MGKLERSTGLDQLAISQFKSLHRTGIWAILTLLRAMGRPPIRIFVGVHQGQVLGTASVIMLEKAGYILGVATDSASRGRGIATHLLERLCLEAQRKGKPWVALDVESDNETALRVYRRLGFEEKVQFSWYVGSASATDTGSAATEVHGSQSAEVADWVNRNLPPAIRDPLPATPRKLTHLEVFTRVTRAQVGTWRLPSSGQTVGVLRGCYLPAINTGFAFPIAGDSALPPESLLVLIEPAVRWFHSLDVARTVAVIQDPPGEWEPVLTTLGLSRAVSTILMVRALASQKGI
jgi:ribosomal protein S18 acetylase RimI-like enzyme